MRPRVLLRRLRVFAGVALALALIGLLAWLFAINWRPATRNFPVQGIDVGEAQGAIDWHRARAANDLRFAWVRATIGARGTDARFAENWRGAFEAGVPRGAIHIFSLCQLAADQAGNFVATVPRSAEQLPFALDLDFEPGCTARPDRGVVIGEIAHFLVAVEAHAGRPGILRVSQDFEARYRVSEAVGRQLWSVQPFFPPSYFDKPWTMWQASRIRRIEGVAAPVNWDVMAR